jgi:hypothetical protein
MIRKLTSNQQEKLKAGTVLFYTPGEYCESFCDNFCVDPDDPKVKVNKYNSKSSYQSGKDPYRDSF